MPTLTIPDRPFLLVVEVNGHIELQSNLKSKVMALGMLTMAQTLVLAHQPPSPGVLPVPGNGQTDRLLRREPSGAEAVNAHGVAMGLR